ncbi:MULTISPECIES: isoprenylcysteine carboxyl methyltransferase family protein [unclassified Brevibacillus]|uniref:isoprenylcysteine carboxyl methyltransferase family protein n=1 Tax=unclassified Brevibacillus TaxID=2684853 RepID=UPI00356859D5
MLLFFGFVMAGVVLQRLVELLIAMRNARYIRSKGGYEVGASHYKYIVLLHFLFFLSLLFEVVGKGSAMVLPSWWAIPFCLFLIAQGLRYWCIRSLGKRWNTRIFILPGEAPIKQGPYRFIRHPNYLVVSLELLLLPLTFSAVATALAFSLLNAWLLLRIRIPMEETSIYDGHRES